MRIWLDITSMPHAVFFHSLIREFEKNGHELLITCRKFSGLEEFLEELQIDYVSVGKHGKTNFEKLVESAKRIQKLAKIVKDFSPHFAIAKHSVELPRVAFGLGITSLLVVDHDPAEAQFRLSVPLASVVVAPKCVKKSYLKKLGAKRVLQFYGVCETAHFKNFKPKNVIRELGISKNSRIILARAEPKYSSHNQKHSKIFETLKLIRENIDCEIIGIPRNSEDKKMFSKLGAIISEKPIDARSVYFYVSIIIGAGSTMNREAALTGTSVISMCPDALPSPDKFLIKLGMIHHILSPKKALLLAEKLMEGTKTVKEKFRELKKNLEKFEDPHEKIKSIIQSHQNLNS